MRSQETLRGFTGTFTLQVTEMFRDTEMVCKIKRALYPDTALMAELRERKTELTHLHKVIDDKDKIICEL